MAIERSASGTVWVTFGRHVIDRTGHHLGNVAALGVDVSGRLSTVVTATTVYPAAAIAGAAPDGAVVIDPERRATVQVDRELGPRARAWTADGVDLRLDGFVVSVADQRLREVVAHAGRSNPMTFPWDSAFVEGNGVSLSVELRRAG